MFTKLSVGKIALLPFMLLLTVVSVHPQATQPPQPGVPVNAVPAHVIEDSSVRAGWRRYGFGARPTPSVILPAAPSNGVETVTGGQVINTYIATTSSGVYVAARVDRIPINMESASEEVRGRYFREFFQGFAKGFQQGLSAKNPDTLELLEVTKVTTAAGRVGFQQRLTLGTTQGRAQMVFVGNSAFCIIAFWFPTAPATDYDFFFGSFRIISNSN